MHLIQSLLKWYMLEINCLLFVLPIIPSRSSQPIFYIGNYIRMKLYTATTDYLRAHIHPFYISKRNIYLSLFDIFFLIFGMRNVNMTSVGIMKGYGIMANKISIGGIIGSVIFFLSFLPYIHIIYSGLTGILFGMQGFAIFYGYGGLLIDAICLTRLVSCLFALSTS